MTFLSTNNAPDAIIFAIGDIHAQHELVETMLKEIQNKITAIPTDKPVKIIFEGDLEDRGSSMPKTFEALIAFKEKMKSIPNVEVVFLCGNHDELVKRILEAKGISDASKGDATNKHDLDNMLTNDDGTLSRTGFVQWLGSGGGWTTFRDYGIEDAKGMLERLQAGGALDEANEKLKQLKEAVPAKHKAFLDEIYPHIYYRYGKEIFTHGGVKPEQTLQELGLDNTQVGLSKKPLSPKEMIYAVDVRNDFLWNDKLNLGDGFRVWHGHTPSDIKDDIGPAGQKMVMIDPQKPYRVCIDTTHYDTKSECYSNESALTCAVIDIKNGQTRTSFMAVNAADPSYVAEYSIAADGPQIALEQHVNIRPEAHAGYSGPKNKWYNGSHATLEAERAALRNAGGRQL